MDGSTAEVAKVIGEVLTNCGLQVDVLPLSEIKDLGDYDGVVVGGPMIMGWHRAAQGFLKKHRSDFQRIPVAIFVMAMSLTQTADMGLEGVPVYLDERLPKPPVKAGSLSFKERYARLSNYLRPVLKAT